MEICVTVFETRDTDFFFALYSPKKRNLRTISSFLSFCKSLNQLKINNKFFHFLLFSIITQQKALKTQLIYIKNPRFFLFQYSHNSKKNRLDFFVHKNLSFLPFALFRIPQKERNEDFHINFHRPVDKNQKHAIILSYH